MKVNRGYNLAEHKQHDEQLPLRRQVRNLSGPDEQ
jgi:hypothetical protein